MIFANLKLEGGAAGYLLAKQANGVWAPLDPGASSSSLVTRTGAQTLTNKTLTSPSFGNGASVETGTAQTTNGTATVVWSKALTDSTVYLLTVTLVGRRTDGTAGRASYKRQVIAYVEGGTLTLGSADTIGTDVETTSAYDITLATSGTTVQVKATGNSGHTIRWNALVEIVAAST